MKETIVSSAAAMLFVLLTAACSRTEATKAKTVLSWDPKHADLQEIVQSAWDWHQAHPNGYTE